MLSLISVYFTTAAGCPQLRELCCCAYPVLFPTWWDHDVLMRDCSCLSPLNLTGAIISANHCQSRSFMGPLKGVNV